MIKKKADDKHPDETAATFDPDRPPKDALEVATEKAVRTAAEKITREAQLTAAMVEGAKAVPEVAALIDASLAERLFNAYNEQGPNPWKTHDGKDVPRFNKLGEQVTAKWVAVARAATAAFATPPSKSGAVLGLGSSSEPCRVCGNRNDQGQT